MTISGVFDARSCEEVSVAAVGGAHYARPHIIHVNVAEIIAKNATNNWTDIVVSSGMMGYMTIDLCWMAHLARKIAD